MAWPRELPQPNTANKRKKIKRYKLAQRDGLKCKFCGEEREERLTVDHIIPLDKNGPDELDNMQILCRDCNSRKGNKLFKN